MNELCRSFGAVLPQYDCFLHLTTMRNVAFAKEPCHMPFGESRPATSPERLGESRDTFRRLKKKGMNTLKKRITIAIRAARSPAA